MNTKFYNHLKRADLEGLRREFVKEAATKGMESGEHGFNTVVSSLEATLNTYSNREFNHPFAKYTERAKKWQL